MSHDLYLKRLRALRQAATKPPAEALAEIQRVMTEAAEDGCIDPKRRDAVGMAVTLAGIAGRAAKKGGARKKAGGE
jgi:hypothetical protein